MSTKETTTMTETYDPNVLPNGGEIEFADDREPHVPDRIEFLNGGFVRATYKFNYEIIVYSPSEIKEIYAHTNHVEDEDWWEN